MDTLSTLFNPGVLFFLLGLFAMFVNSNLRIPESIVKFISLYLMIAIGFKGGVSLYTSPMAGSAWISIAIVMAMSAFVPIYSYYLLKDRMGVVDACAIGATYGSNSTLTFITAAAFLTSIDVVYGAYMTIALVLMETPAILFSLWIAHRKGFGEENTNVYSAFTDGTVITLLGSLVIGYLTVFMGTNENVLTQFISGDMFNGMLIFFLMYMGTLVGQKILEIEYFPSRLMVFAALAPVVNGIIALFLAYMFSIPEGSSLLLVILCASSSYIVAPAILKDALPQANPAHYLTMSMAITFPLNIVLGIPIYWYLINTLWP